MLKSLSIVMAVALACSFAMGDVSLTQDFPSTRDASILGHPDEQLGNTGARSQNRVAKGNQHLLIIDFDWDAVQAFIDAEIETDYVAKVEMRLTASDFSAGGLSYGFAALEMGGAGMDWSQGDGADYNAFNWTVGTTAANWFKPGMNNVGTEDPLDPNTWTDDGNIWPNDQPLYDTAMAGTLSYVNSTEVAFPTDSLVSWTVIDPELIAAQFDDATVQGLQVWDLNSNWTNTSVFMHEQNSSTWPLVRVSFEPDNGGGTYLPGDADEDMDVDGSDLAAVGLNWSPGATDKVWTDGDFDGNGNVDGSDLAAVGLNWAPGGYTLPGVPEPATMSLLALGAVALIRRKK